MEKYRIIQLVGDPKTEIGTFYIQRRVFFFFWKNYTKEKYYSLSEAQDALSEIIYKQKKYRVETAENGMLRIIALKDFSDVKEGDKGGLIETRDNLSQEGDCWVYENAQVSDNARVCDNAKVYDDAFVHGHAEISGNAQVYEKAEISGYIRVSGNAKVHGNSTLYGHYTKYTIIE